MLLSSILRSQVALATGFSDQAHYCQVFRDVMGIIPAARRVDRYARRVGVAAAREINNIPARRPSDEESMSRRAGISQGAAHRKPVKGSGRGYQSQTGLEI